MRGHRKSFVALLNEKEFVASAEWDEEDRLRITVDGRIFWGDPQETSSEVEEVEILLKELTAARFKINCCATCRYFVYAGLGADTGSSIGSCSEGKVDRYFTRADYTSMTDSCDAFVGPPEWRR
jgi:hypothetical protein